MVGSRIEDIMLIAEDHDGVITTAAARSAGITPMTLVKMAQRGRLVRLHRGVYRLPLYPHRSNNFSKFHEALAWVQSSNGPIGTISHESALSVYEISDALPAKIHLTIPVKTRFQRRAIPKLYIIHRADLAISDITTHNGIRVTSPARSIIDVFDSGRADFAWQALRDAREQGFIGRGLFEELDKEMTSRFDK